MIEGICKACGGTASSEGSDDMKAWCNRTHQYIWVCDACGTYFHLQYGFPTPIICYCPNCSSDRIRGYAGDVIQEN